MKKLIASCITLLMCAPALADSFIYVTNKTDKTITPRLTQVGTKNKDIYTFSMDPREIYKIVSGKADLNKGMPVASGKNIKILRLNRNVGVKSGRNYVYHIRLDGPGMPQGNDALYVLVKLRGKAIASDMWFAVATQSELKSPRWVEVTNALNKINPVALAHNEINDIKNKVSSKINQLLLKSHYHNATNTVLVVRSGDTVFTLSGQPSFTFGDAYQNITFTVTATPVTGLLKYINTFKNKAKHLKAQAQKKLKQAKQKVSHVKEHAEKKASQIKTKAQEKISKAKEHVQEDISSLKSKFKKFKSRF